MSELLDQIDIKLNDCKVCGGIVEPWESQCGGSAISCNACGMTMPPSEFYATEWNTLTESPKPASEIQLTGEYHADINKLLDLIDKPASEWVSVNKSSLSKAMLFMGDAGVFGCIPHASTPDWFVDLAYSDAYGHPLPTPPQTKEC